MNKKQQARDGESLKRAMDKSDKEQKLEKASPPVDPEKLRVATASVVLQELEMWPEDIQALIGEDHPNPESFLKGVPYVIGAYMHIAKTNLDRKVKEAIKRVGTETAKKMGPATRLSSDLRRDWRQSIENELNEISKEERSKVKVVMAAIKRRYVRRRQAVHDRQPPEAVLKLEQELRDLEETYEGEVKAIESTSDILFDEIKQIESGAESWNSKGRKKARKAHQKAKTEARIATKEAEERAKIEEDKRGHAALAKEEASDNVDKRV